MINRIILAICFIILPAISWAFLSPETMTDTDLATAGMYVPANSGNFVTFRQLMTNSPVPPNFNLGTLSSGNGINLTANLTGTVYASGMFINMTANGAGVNGPQYAQVGLTVEYQKNGYLLGTAAVGELDGIYIQGRQDGAGSDGGGLLIDVRNTGLGFISSTEFNSAIVNSGGTVTQDIDIQEGGMSASTGSYIGGYYASLAGTQTSAIVVQNKSGVSYWTAVLKNIKDGTTNIEIDDGGNINPVTSITASGNITTTAGEIFAKSLIVADNATDGIIVLGGDSSNGSIEIGKVSSAAKGSIAWHGNSVAGNAALLQNDGAGILSFTGLGSGSTNVFQVRGNTVLQFVSAASVGQINAFSSNLLLQTGSALATNATVGFVLLPTTTGAPTGTIGGSGQSAYVVRTDNHKICHSEGGGTWYYADGTSCS